MGRCVLLWVKVHNFQNPELLKFKIFKLAGWLHKWIIYTFKLK